jgi:hypothetical protein
VDQVILVIATKDAYTYLAFRNFELCGLQRRDIEFGLRAPAPYFTPHFRVTLENRKGWQSKVGQDGPLEGK